MTTGLKVWLWIVFIANIISGVWTLILALVAPLLWVSVAFTAVYLVGVAMILFTQKKMGLYIIVGASVVSIVISMISGNYTAIFQLLGPLIIYLLMRKNWSQFA